MNPSGGRTINNVNLCRSCNQYACNDPKLMCGTCLMKAADSMGRMASGSSNPGPSHTPVTNPSGMGQNSGPRPAAGPQLPGHIPGFPNHAGPAPPGTANNANFFPFFSSLDGVSEQDFNNAVFSEAGNLNFLGQNFASAVPPNFGNINHSSSSPNMGSLDNESSQHPSDSNRFSSPPYEEEDDLNGIWVGDKTSADNVFYYGCFPGSLLGSSNKETQELTISTAAKRHLLELYFKFHYPFFPVLHKPTIMTQFNQGKLPMLLLNVIFAVAYFYTTEESYNFFPQLRDKSNEEVAQEFEAQAKKCLDECFSEAEIYTIQALLLMTLYHHRTTVSNNVWLYSGMATRMAMELGLHKDCENLLNGAFEPVEQEIRKKTWWGCFVLDTMYSTMLGRPLSIQQELCDVKLPALADDEDDPQEIACTQVFIAMSKLGQIVGKLNRLLTSVKLKSNLQDRATRAHDCLVSLKNWFKMLPPALKKISDSPPENVAEIKNCYSEALLTPLLHAFYHTAIIVGQVLVHTDGLFRVTNTNLMGDAIHSATEIVRIMTRFDAFYAAHGLSFKFYPLYVSAFLFLHKIKVSATPTPPPQSQDGAQSSGDQWYSLFLSCLSTLNKFSRTSENGRYCMTVLVGMAEHQKVKLPEAFKRTQALIQTQNLASANQNHPFFAAAMSNPQAIFSMVGNGLDAQALAEMAAMGQNGQFNIDLNAAISSLGSQSSQYGGQMFNPSLASQNTGGSYAGYGSDQFAMGLFRPEDLMNLPTGLAEEYVDPMMNSQGAAQIEEIDPAATSSTPQSSVKPSQEPPRPTAQQPAQQPAPKSAQQAAHQPVRRTYSHTQTSSNYTQSQAAYSQGQPGYTQPSYTQPQAHSSYNPPQANYTQPQANFPHQGQANYNPQYAFSHMQHRNQQPTQPVQQLYNQPSNQYAQHPGYAQPINQGFAYSAGTQPSTVPPPSYGQRASDPNYSQLYMYQDPAVPVNYQPPNAQGQYPQAYAQPPSYQQPGYASANSGNNPQYQQPGQQHPR
ncbi:hypothetical protein L0F63_003888 [Massospora cicadina]|nr:hypothetical protein L0F63_003888 [Massospora cicadina]